MDCLINKLNDFLCNLNVFYRKLQNYHWNVVGKDFFVVHSKLEEYYDEINKQVDEIAEHILVLGGQPLARMQDYLEKAEITEAENMKVKDDLVFKNITKDYETLLGNCIKIKEEADKTNNYATSSLIDEYILDYSKKLWMLKQMQSC
mgnify:CR=1 FL=1